MEIRLSDSRGIPPAFRGGTGSGDENHAIDGERGPAGFVGQSTACTRPPTLTLPHKGGGECYAPSAAKKRNGIARLCRRIPP